jgi:lipoyl(octanoyl) transferase
MICHIHDLGLMDYQPAWDLQNRLVVEIARGKRPPTLLLVEHPHTYTFGRRGRVENLLWDENQLKARGISVYWADRGGDVTYHGPGQLVGYPLIPLTPISPVRFETDYVGYVRNLEKMLITALAKMGLESSQLNGKTGVWVKRGESHNLAKIAAIGVKVDAQGVTRHGFALNVNPDMSYFEGIVPCGISEYPVVSLAGMLSPPLGMEAVKGEVIRAFGQVFGYETAITGV